MALAIFVGGKQKKANKVKLLSVLPEALAVSKKYFVLWSGISYNTKSQRLRKESKTFQNVGHHTHG